MSIISLMDSGFCALLKKISVQDNPASYFPTTSQVRSSHLVFTCTSRLRGMSGRGLAVFLKHIPNFPNIIYYRFSSLIWKVTCIGHETLRGCGLVSGLCALLHWFVCSPLSHSLMTEFSWASSFCFLSFRDFLAILKHFLFKCTLYLE